MPSERSVTDDSGPSGVRAYTVRTLPVAFLVGIWLWLVYSTGGYGAKSWAFPALAVGVIGVIAAALRAYPRRPQQLSLAVLAFCTAYAVWVLASNLWGASSLRAWTASGRTFTYLLVLSLALAFFTSSLARAAFKYLLMAAACVLLVVAIWRLWSAADLAQLFIANRLAYPIGHPDSAAALFLIPLWPLVWLAAAPAERAPVRGAAIGLATGLLGLALMTQSRGAAWSLGISLIIFFALSPARLRLLFYLVVPGLLMVYAYPHLNLYWTEGAIGISGGMAARTLTVAALAAGFIGMIVALLERWVKVSVRMKAIFGTVILAGCAAGLIYGAITLTDDTGGPMAWFDDAWGRLVSEPATGQPAASGSVQGAARPTRGDAWLAEWRQWQHTPALGAGADNTSATLLSVDGSGSASTAQTPHTDSLVLNVLSDTGIVAGILVFGAIVLSVGGILWPRTAAGWNRVRRRTSRWGREPMEYGWEMALLAGMVYWFAQANLEQLWQVTGITLPVILMLAAALAATDARAGAMWPRLGSRARPQPLWPRLRSWLLRKPDPQTSAAVGALRPGEPVSEGFRVGLIVVSAAVLVLAVSSYLLESL